MHIVKALFNPWRCISFLLLQRLKREGLLREESLFTQYSDKDPMIAFSSVTSCSFFVDSTFSVIAGEMRYALCKETSHVSPVQWVKAHAQRRFGVEALTGA